MAAFTCGCLFGRFTNLNGAAGDVVEAVGARLGMSLVGWTADPQEWRDPPIGEVISYLRDKRTDGMVVLLHDRKWLTLQITRTLLDEFTREGWRFEALPACRPTGSQEGRVATRTPGDLPVGQVQRVWRIGDEVVLDGWAFDADHWGAGYATEAMTAALLFRARSARWSASLSGR